MDLDRRERLYLSGWAVGLWFFVISFAGLMFFDAYTVHPDMFNGLMFGNIILGLLASQPPFYNFLAIRKTGRSPHPVISTVMMAAGSLLIFSLPAMSLFDIGSVLWMRTNTLATGVVVFRLGQLLREDH